jgi:dihydrofolate reductase
VAGKVLWHLTMSLDGFIAGADDEMDWVFEVDAGPSAIADEIVETMGAILAGRRWYDMVTARFGRWEGIYGRKGVYGGRWRGPIFVLTHRPSDVRDDAGVTLLSDGIEEAVATARAAAGGKNMVVFGASIAEQCLEAGLLDEIVVHVAPLLLGDGVRLYGRTGVGRVDLERTAVAESGQLTDLRFRVAQPGSSRPATS